MVSNSKESPLFLCTPAIRNVGVSGRAGRKRREKDLSLREENLHFFFFDVFLPAGDIFLPFSSAPYISLSSPFSGMPSNKFRKDIQWPGRHAPMKFFQVQSPVLFGNCNPMFPSARSCLTIFLAASNSI